jgi:hypothetical protein
MQSVPRLANDSEDNVRIQDEYAVRNEKHFQDRLQQARKYVQRPTVYRTVREIDCSGKRREPLRAHLGSARRGHEQGKCQGEERVREVRHTVEAHTLVETRCTS